LKPAELQAALNQAKAQSEGLDLKQNAKLMHGLLDAVAAEKGYLLKLRK
jgi:hypothetical protein